MIYKPKHVFINNIDLRLSSKLVNKLLEIESIVCKNGYFTEGNIEGEWVKIDDDDDFKNLKYIYDEDDFKNLKYIYIGETKNFCYYDEKTEERIIEELKKSGIDLEEVSLSFEEYIIREII